MLKSKHTLSLWVLLSYLSAASVSAQATFSFIYTDGPDFGFNSTTPVSPVGGNTGVTLGEQRRKVLERAVAVWGQHLSSDETIIVTADFDILGGSSSSATLAFARVLSYENSPAGAPLTNTWYPAALANSFTGNDENPGTADIEIGINESIDSDPVVLGGIGYYNGLDNVSGDQIDLLNILLHELGHGFGFSSRVNQSTGSLPANIPDAYTRNIYDAEQAKAWEDMTNAERAASAVNGPDVVWRGGHTTAAAREVIGTVRLEITDPSSVGGPFTSGLALFGPLLTMDGLEGKLVLVDDGVAPVTDACESPFVNSAEIAGNIALIDRGTCFFVDKIRSAQLAGATAVVIVNNQNTGVINMAGEAPDVTIPSVFISKADGDIIKALLPDTIVRMKIEGEGEGVGTLNGQVQIYTPSTLESGSSVSHWDLSASPDLLMEPNISDNLRIGIDLTLTAMKDIGWEVKDVPFVHYTYDLWRDETFGPADLLTAKTDDPDTDGKTNFEEYAYGCDPLVPDALSPVTSIDKLEDVLILGYTKNPTAVDVAISVEGGDDLQTWTRSIPTIEQARTPMEQDRASLTVDVPAVGTARFYRLRVEER